MISVDIKARIGEIRFKGDKSCIFIISGIDYILKSRAAETIKEGGSK